MIPPTNQAEDIRPIREAVSIHIPTPEAETSHLPLILWVLGGVAAIAALIALAIWLKRRAEAKRIPNLKQKAIQHLTDSQKLMTPEHSREFAIAVSNILRQFIEARFKLPSTRRTTPEFLQHISQDKNLSLGVYRKNLDHFFNKCDLGKFSGHTFSAKEMTTLHQAALDVIQSEH